MSHLLPTAAPTVEGVPRHSEAAVPQEVHPDPDHQSDSSQTARAEHKCEYRTDDRLQSMKKRLNETKSQLNNLPWTGGTSTPGSSTPWPPCPRWLVSLPTTSC